MIKLGQDAAQAGTSAQHILQAQAQALRQQIDGTARFRDELMTQLHRASNPSQAAEFSSRIAESENIATALQSQLTEISKQIAQYEAAPPPFPGVVWGNPEPARGPLGIHPDAITAAFIILTVGVIVPLSIGIARRLWRRPQSVVGPPRDAEASGRLERLEQAVDTIAIEIERISESQRFVAKVLTERPVAVRATAANIGGEAAAVGEGAPMLALGAGPIEPIPMQQRQAVKQSITPH